MITEEIGRAQVAGVWKEVLDLKIEWNLLDAQN
jgi:hypothetical protein